MPLSGHWHGQTGSIQAGEIRPSDQRAGEGMVDAVAASLSKATYL
jgi:hypothetical protein